MTPKKGGCLLTQLVPLMTPTPRTKGGNRNRPRKNGVPQYRNIMSPESNVRNLSPVMMETGNFGNCPESRHTRNLSPDNDQCNKRYFSPVENMRRGQELEFVPDEKINLQNARIRTTVNNRRNRNSESSNNK